MKRLIPFALLALMACGSSPSSPSLLSVDGTWTGTIVSSVQSPGQSATARITFTQTRSDVSGSWSAGFSAGQLTGTIHGGSVEFVLHSSVATDCPTQVNLTVDNNKMNGTYATVNCSVADGGTVLLTKQG